MKKLSFLSPVIIRVGLALVFLWFGFNQYTNVSAWTRMVPQSIVDMTSLSATTIVQINGVFELVCGALLLFGFFTRFVAFILSLHLIHITYIMGYTGIGVRDFGLSAAIVSVWLHGPDFFSLDRLFGRGGRD